MHNINEMQLHIFPIFKPHEEKENRPVIQGSATWISIDGFDFVVTANHVLDTSDGRMLFLPGTHELVIDSKDIVRTSAPPCGDFEADPLDIAVFRLKEEWKQSLVAIQKRPLQISDCAIEAYPLPGRSYTLFGYPDTSLWVDFGRHSLTPGPHAFTCPGVPPAKIAEFGWNPASNIVATFNREEMKNSEGAVVTAPEPYGMSGGPVVAVDNRTGFAHMVGVGIYYDNEKHYWVGTRFSYVIEAFRSVPEIARYFPKE